MELLPSGAITPLDGWTCRESIPAAVPASVKLFDTVPGTITLIADVPYDQPIGGVEVLSMRTSPALVASDRVGLLAATSRLPTAANANAPTKQAKMRLRVIAVTVL